jgi:peptidoglycan/xylan/chitin deacetylase (PgdA/CDA1 family)
MNRVINFHGISDGPWFERIINILKSKYSMLSIDEIEDMYYSDKKISNGCHLTFDDGDISFYNIVYPILKKHNLPATIFVSPNIIKNENNFWFQEIKDYKPEEVKKIICEFLNIKFSVLNNYSLFAILKCLKIDQIWTIIHIYQKRFNVAPGAARNINVEQLLEIDSHGLVKIGAHTLNHPILANERDDKSSSEITGSINGLKELLGHEIKYFAYPNGFPVIDFGSREINILKQNNCRIAFSCEPGSFNIQNNPLSVDRIGFSHGSLLFVKTKLFLGAYWDSIRDFIIKGEIQTRIEIDTKILKKSMMVNMKHKHGTGLGSISKITNLGKTHF